MSTSPDMISTAAVIHLADAARRLPQGLITQLVDVVRRILDGLLGHLQASRELSRASQLGEAIGQDVSSTALRTAILGGLIGLFR